MHSNIIDISQSNLRIAEIASIVHFEKNFVNEQRKLILRMIAVDLVFLFWVGLTVYLPFHTLR